MEDNGKKWQENKPEAATEALDKDGKGKKVNRTWEAFGRSKGCFVINDPKLFL